MAVHACNLLAEMGPIVRESGLKASDINMPWTRIIQGAAQCETGRRDGSVDLCEGVGEDVPCELEDIPCNVVYSVLNAMTTFPSDNNDRTYEALSNALVRRVLFVTGAVNMAGLPPADRGEAVFVGRSNVGKSSLVNMVRSSGNLLVLNCSVCRILSIVPRSLLTFVTSRSRIASPSLIQANDPERLSSSTTSQ